MNLKLHAWRLSGTTEYPVWSIAIALVLIALSLFLPVYLCYVAFVICMYRIVCYDAKVFATDYCLLIPWARLFRTAGGMTLLVWLCLIAAIWYLIRGKLRANTALVILILLLNYLLLRMNMAVNNFGLCFGQLCVLFVLLPHGRISYWHSYIRVALLQLLQILSKELLPTLPYKILCFR